MIIRPELGELEHHISPKVWKVPFLKPIGLHLRELPMPDEPLDMVALVFTPETDRRIYGQDVFVRWNEVPYRWSCTSCYAACGAERGVFSTDWVRFEHLKMGEPTYTQREQISDHARHHQILYAWAKAVK